jgi:hypothetical protein
MFTALDSWFGVDPAFTALLGGIGLIVTAVVHNEGMAGALTELRRPAMALTRRRSVRPSSLPVALLTDDGVA